MVGTFCFNETRVRNVNVNIIASWMFVTRSFSGNDCKQYRTRLQIKKCAKLNAQQLVNVTVVESITKARICDIYGNESYSLITHLLIAYCTMKNLYLKYMKYQIQLSTDIFIFFINFNCIEILRVCIYKIKIKIM